MDHEIDWNSPSTNKLSGSKVIVKRDNIDGAIRTLKRKLAQEGVLKDLQRHEQFTSNTQKRRKKEAEAKRRWMKKQRMVAELD